MNKFGIAAPSKMMGTLLAALLSGMTLAQEATTATPIKGVIAANTPIQLVKEGFDGTEGPLPQADGGLLFTENRAGRVIRVLPDGTTSVWLASSGNANALAASPHGDMVAALTGDKPGIGVLKLDAPPRFLVEAFEGKPFGRPNDLVVSRRNDVYFSDPGVAVAGSPPPRTAVFRLSASGELSLLTDAIGRPNGVALSPDERTLYVADTAGEWVVAFDLDRQGAAKAHRNFARLSGFRQTETGPSSGADGLAVDAKGRLYVATTVGVQVFSPRGEALGVIALPKAPQNLAFAGKGRDTLYVVGRGSVYRIATETRGPRRAGK
ncbi:MAG: SMP-30/gluconolactonase/LRE family protein [Steroidobacteraceae bacterium]